MNSLDSSSSFSLTRHIVHVLLVDDQNIIAQFVMRALSTEEEIEFHYCHNPAMALETAINVQPTVILQDLVMPDIDGLALVAEYRNHPLLQSIPIIVLSATEDAGTKADAFKAGANDYMVKPFQKLELLARVRYHSRSYINMLERDEAFNALRISQEQLEIKNRFIRNTFGRYLSDDVVESILDTPEGLHFGGEKRVVTIMMSDLRGFTAISEKLPPESVVHIINLFLETMTEIILKYNGTIDEFIGDAILVIFGAPILRADDASRAVACALEMQSIMPKVNQVNRELGFPELALGIGINTGPVVVGNIGSMKRAKYGVVGQNVNLTGRIESYTVGGQILISDTTCQAVGPILRIDDQMEVMPKGVSNPIMLYEIGGIGGGYDIFLEKHDVSLMPLSIPMVVRFNILASKFAGQVEYQGVILAISPEAAQIRADVDVTRLDNLKMTLLNEDGEEITNELYAKVTRIESGSVPALFVCVFTAVPQEALTFFSCLHH
ncbi:MAG: response regulator [Magnetococcus sp. YQC-5]